MWAFQTACKGRMYVRFGSWGHSPATTRASSVVIDQNYPGEVSLPDNGFVAGCREVLPA